MNLINILFKHVYIQSFRGFGYNASKLNFPSGISVDNNRNLYVADKGNNKIKKFNVEEREI